ncbi:MAG: site-specific integrase [Clostridia bacterium]|nr:site-specific integrase [Clostridia bacterium]
MPKKSNTKREDGRFAVQVYIGKVNGKRKYKTVYGKTQKEANQKADEIRTSLKKGIDVTSSNDSFETWADYWLNSKKQEVSADQYNVIESRIRIWKSYLKGYKVNQIAPLTLQTIIYNIAEKNPYTGRKTAKGTLKSYIQIVTSVFNFAIDNRIMDFNPAARLKLPQDAPQKKRRALSAEERQRVIEFEHRAKPFAMLLMLSGLRRGEATALQWNDIDFDNNQIVVSKSFNFKQKTFKSPKNGKTRIVSVPQLLIDYLGTLERHSPFVLTSANGTMMSDTAWKRLFDSYMTDLNLEYGKFTSTPNKFSPKKAPMMISTFTPHELRHTFCTIMYEAGVDVLTAKEQMGHSDVKTTLEIYTHLDAEKKKNDISKLDAFLTPQKANASQMQVKSS